MSRVKYDLHLHSCLSPCGDDEMTPNNLVNMAALLGYQMIALTDHNTCGNTAAAVAAGRQAGILVIPGMELTTEEEAHVVCLFPTVEQAMGFDELVTSRRQKIVNKPEIFGHQYLMDEEDNRIGEKEFLLLNASDISVNEVKKLTAAFEGTAFPAHVDKDSYSVIASLGAIPPEAGFRAAEVSRRADLHRLLGTNPELKELLLLRNSDAHYLENMPDPSAWLELAELTPAYLIACLNGMEKTVGAWE